MPSFQSFFSDFVFRSLTSKDSTCEALIVIRYAELDMQKKRTRDVARPHHIYMLYFCEVACAEQEGAGGVIFSS